MAEEEGSGLPSGADLDQDAVEKAAKDATAGGVIDSAGSASPGTEIPPANSYQQDRLAKANAAVNQHLGKDTDTTDTIGKPKEGGKPAPVGPRGTNAPRDAKPAPTDKEKKSAQPKITVTDAIDSAGSAKNVEHLIGIRGQHTNRDTYKL